MKIFTHAENILNKNFSAFTKKYLTKSKKCVIIYIKAMTKTNRLYIFSQRARDGAILAEVG